MRVGATGRISLSSEEPENGLRPSVSCLFRSVAEAYGPNAIGVLLTGMGKDGLDGLKSIKKQGGFVVAQDEETCIVYGMPKAAVDEKVADVVVPLLDIPKTLNALAGVQN